MLRGPGSDKLFALVGKEVEAAIDAQTGIADPAGQVCAVGTQRYNASQGQHGEDGARAAFTTLVEAQDYAMSALDLETTIIDKMGQLTNEEYESILRPVFKDDEPTMIAVGAILGGVVGEIQVQVIEHFGHNPEAVALALLHH